MDATCVQSGGVVKAADADVDLPKDSTVASAEQITLPDSLFDDPFASSTGLNFDKCVGPV